MDGVGALAVLVVSRLATLSPDVALLAGTAAFGAADVPGRDAAARCGRRPAESLGDGLDGVGVRVGVGDAAAVVVSAGKPLRAMESTVATGRTRVDSAAVVLDPVVRSAPLPSVPAHDTVLVRSSSMHALHSCRDDEFSIALQAITGRATVRRSR